MSISSYSSLHLRKLDFKHKLQISSPKHINQSQRSNVSVGTKTSASTFHLKFPSTQSELTPKIDCPEELVHSKSGIDAKLSQYASMLTPAMSKMSMTNSKCFKLLHQTNSKGYIKDKSGMQSFDFYQTRYYRDDYITYKNSYFNMDGIKNYLIHPEVESRKIRTKYLRQNSFDRIFPPEDSKSEQKCYIRINSSFGSPSAQTVKFNNRQAFSPSQNPDKDFNKTFSKAYYSKGLSDTVIGSSDLLLNANSKVIMSKPQPNQLKILSIFKNDKFFKKLPKEAVTTVRNSRSPSFRDLNSRKKNDNEISYRSEFLNSKNDRSDSVKERLSYSQNITYKEDNVTPKVTSIPYNVVAKSNKAYS